MEELGKTFKNLGIDIGNYNVKTSEGVIFKSAVSENIEYGNKFDKIEIDSKTYYKWKNKYYS